MRRPSEPKPPKDFEADEKPKPPRDWSALLDLLAERVTNSKRWQRADPFLKQRAIEFDRQRSAGVYGRAYQSAAERASSKQQPQAQACTA